MSVQQRVVRWPTWAELIQEARAHTGRMKGHGGSTKAIVCAHAQDEIVQTWQRSQSHGEFGGQGWRGARVSAARRQSD